MLVNGSVQSTSIDHRRRYVGEVCFAAGSLAIVPRASLAGCCG